MTPGSRIASLRKSKGMSQELLAEAAKISLRTIQRIETDNTVARPYTLKAIASALDISMDEFMPSTTEASPSVDVLKAINFSALSVIILPVFHILIVFFTSRRLSEKMGLETRRILSFQIIWTILTGLLLGIVVVVQSAFTNSKAIGQLPPTIVMVYAITLITNVAFVFHASIRLNKQETSIFSFIPVLF